MNLTDGHATQCQGPVIEKNFTYKHSITYMMQLSSISRKSTDEILPPHSIKGVANNILINANYTGSSKRVWEMKGRGMKDEVP